MIHNFQLIATIYSLLFYEINALPVSLIITLMNPLNRNSREAGVLGSTRFRGQKVPNDIIIYCFKHLYPSLILYATTHTYNLDSTRKSIDGHDELFHSDIIIRSECLVI